jgi:hypothetical protein
MGSYDTFELNISKTLKNVNEITYRFDNLVWDVELPIVGLILRTLDSILSENKFVSYTVSNLNIPGLAKR